MADLRLRSLVLPKLYKKGTIVASNLDTADLSIAFTIAARLIAQISNQLHHVSQVRCGLLALRENSISVSLHISFSSSNASPYILGIISNLFFECMIISIRTLLNHLRTYMGSQSRINMRWSVFRGKKLETQRTLL